MFKSHRTVENCVGSQFLKYTRRFFPWSYTQLTWVLSGLCILGKPDSQSRSSSLSIFPSIEFQVEKPSVVNTPSQKLLSPNLLKKKSSWDLVPFKLENKLAPVFLLGFACNVFKATNFPAIFIVSCGQTGFLAKRSSENHSVILHDLPSEAF